MTQEGILTEYARVEHIDGEIVQTTPIGRRNAACVDRLNRLFADNLGHAVQIRVQNPVRLDEHSEPQPDVALLRPRPDFYASGHPTPADVLLLVEVAETSVQVDRQVKVPLYARSGLPEVWLVDLEQETITVYCDPSPGGYRTSWTVRRSDALPPRAIADPELAVARLLGES